MNNEQFFQVGQVFTPNTAVSQQDLFSGRKAQIKSLLRAITGQGSHAVIFGERGVGKTSLGRIIKSFLPPQYNIPLAIVSCDSNMSFSSLWSGILRELFIGIPKQDIGFQRNESVESIPLSKLVSDTTNITSQDVRLALESLPSSGIIVIDELDRLDDKTTLAMADTLKTLSDYNVKVTLILIGVGDSVGALIKGHESIERALVQIHMPRMDQDELAEIITKGLAALEMSIKKNTEAKIIALSRGLPHYTHLLMFHAAQHSAENDHTNLSDEDFKYAVKQSVTEKGQSLKNLYMQAIQSTKRAYLFRPVLLACALSSCDEDGFFAPSDVQKPLEKILGKIVPLAAFISHIGSFCSESRGTILERTGNERKYRYRFKNPLMQTFVIMKALDENFTSATPIETLILDN